MAGVQKKNRAAQAIFKASFCFKFVIVPLVKAGHMFKAKGQSIKGLRNNGTKTMHTEAINWAIDAINPLCHLTF